MRRAAMIALVLAAAPAGAAELAVRARTLHTMTGAPLRDAVVIVRDGKISEVGPASRVAIPPGTRILDAAVVTPGLLDARGTVGVSGIFNLPHDQDQIDRSAAVQPELRALDAYNPLDALVAWVRSFGVTAVHTGHAPGELVPGQVAVMKTDGRTADRAAVAGGTAIAVTLGPRGLRSGDKSPGTRGKAVAMLRQELVKAREYAAKLLGPEDKRPSRDLKLEALSDVLARRLPLMVTADRAQDISGALRLREEFGFRMILEGAAEGYLLADALREGGVPVVVHPPMYRAWGEYENASFETAAKLRDAGVTIAFGSGFESYVPKTRVVLLEAAIAAANGLGPERALAALTIDAARILGVEDRLGSIEPGKDGDLALYDGDPLEYTTHCVGTVIEGAVFEGKR